MADGNEPQPEDREPDSLETGLLWHYLDRINAGEALDPEEILRQHPDLGPELLAQLGAFQRLLEPPRSDEPLGTLGDYTLRRVIGRGGMGVVYDAWQGSMSRRVALKVLPVGVATDRRAITRFLREAQAAGQLNHPNVVAVHAMGIDEKTPYYAMELVEGETLAQIRARIEKAAPDDETPFGPLIGRDYSIRLARAFADVADGLQHAHSKGIVHRDIKPSNLILDGGSRLRILDFGLAHLEGEASLTISGDLVGTPLYMSPEQARREKTPVDHRTDIYSLGATLYEMLTLRPPFKGKDNSDTLSQIVEREPTEPRRLNPRIPADLETIVLKCLRKDPGNRYGTAEALGQDLRRFVRGDPVEARPEAPLDRLLRRLRRHRRRLSLVTGACLLLAVTAILFLKFRAAERNRAEREYAEIIERAAVVLERQSPLGMKTAGNVDILNPAIANFIQYSVPGLFERYELAPPPDLLADLERAARLVRERPEAHYYLAKGLALGGERQRDAARVLLDAALERDGSFVPALFLREEILAAGRREEGLRSLRELIERMTVGGWRREWLQAQLALKRFAWLDAARTLDGLTERLDGGEKLYLGAKAEIWLAAAKAYLGAGDLDHAIAYLTVGHHYLWPEALQPMLLLAKAHHLDGKPDRAEALFEAASASIDPDVGGPLLVGGILLSLGDKNRALAWTKRIADPTLEACAASQVLVEKGEPEKAEALARKAQSLRPDRPWPWAALGDALLSQGRYVKAQEAYQRSVDVDPRYVPGRAGVGVALCAQGRLEAGIAHLREAIERDPGVLLAHFELGRALMAAGRLREAGQALEAALEVYPAEPSFHTALGFILMRGGRHAEAIAGHRLALKLSPRHHTALIHLAMLYAERRQVGESLKAFLEAFRVEPSSTSSFPYVVDLFLCSQALEDDKTLRTLLELVEENLPELERAPRLAAMATLALGHLHARTGEALARALEWAERGVTTSEGRNPEMLLVEARTLLALGRKEEARGVLEEACRLLEGALRSTEEGAGEADFSPLLGAIVPRPHLRVAEALRVAGDAARAEEFLRQGLTAYPDASKELWDLWLCISFVELRRPLASLLEELPGASEERPPEGDPGIARRSYSREIRWLLSTLAGGGSLRLSEELEVAGPGRPSAYKEVVPRIGYHVPLPPGRYCVTLELADSTGPPEEGPLGEGLSGSSLSGRDISGPARGSAIEIKIEGEVADAGGGQAESSAALQADGRHFAATVRVDDGILDIDVGDDARDAPVVSAIEVSQVD